MKKPTTSAGVAQAVVLTYAKKRVLDCGYAVKEYDGIDWLRDDYTDSVYLMVHNRAGMHYRLLVPVDAGIGTQGILDSVDRSIVAMVKYFESTAVYDNGTEINFKTYPQVTTYSGWNGVFPLDPEPVKEPEPTHNEFGEIKP